MTKRTLSVLHYSGLDKIYQQVGTESGVIFTLHRVRPYARKKFRPNAHLEITPEFLERLIIMLKRRGFEFFSMADVKERIENPDRNSRFAAFTFDDGYRDNVQHAVPILQKHEVPYTIYCVPGFVEGTADIWWEAIEDLVRQQSRILLHRQSGPVELDCTSTSAKLRSYGILLEYLTQEVPENGLQQRVRELCWLYKIELKKSHDQGVLNWTELQQQYRSPLCTIGAHTLSHPMLARLSDARAMEEMEQCASLLEAEFGQRLRHFAYPYGYRRAVSVREFEMAKSAGFETAVTTRPGMIFPDHAPHLTALPRISVNGLYQRLRHMGPLSTGLPTRLQRGFKKLNVR